MLQQTRCEAVKPYYRHFLDELPSAKELAEVPDETLLKLWQGLGYYSRARNLKKAAQQIVYQHGGTLPCDFASLRALTGIGDYTAGAIASIAFDIPVPAVDGNVLRVVSRVTADERDITSPAFKKDVTSQIATIIPKDTPGDFNQALIELGATLCGPGHAALCGSCPLALHCQALKEGKTDLLPIKRKQSPRKICPRTLYILQKDDTIALAKRQENGLLAGMYEIPSIDGHKSESELRSYLSDLGYTVNTMERLPDAKHIFTHLEWHMHAYFVTVTGESQHTFYTQEELERLPLPGAFAVYKQYIFL